MSYKKPTKTEWKEFMFFKAGWLLAINRIKLCLNLDLSDNECEELFWKYKEKIKKSNKKR